MSSHIRQSCVTFEAILSDSSKKYQDKVNALLAAWEHVANDITRARHPQQQAQQQTQPPQQQQQQQQQQHHDTPEALVEWANEHTLKLVLSGEWPKLANATKTHLTHTLERCARELAQQKLDFAARRCSDLVDLVRNPWGKPTLDKIIHGQLSQEHEEEEFCCQEKGELLKMRLRILCEDRCEDLAMHLAAACVRSLRRSNRLRDLSEPSHVQYMMDVYMVLLAKLKRTQEIVAQLKLMELQDSLELMQRLSGERPTKYGTARVWRSATKAAHIVAQYLVTTGMLRPMADPHSSETFTHVLNSWALLHAKGKHALDTLPDLIRKLIEPAESAQHIYLFCHVLVQNFGDGLKSLVIELYIRALTTDMNELEDHRINNEKEKIQETSQRLSRGFLHLADYVDLMGVARECVLTAFSLHPTRPCYDRIREMAWRCGKIGSLEKEAFDAVAAADNDDDDDTTPVVKLEVADKADDSISSAEHESSMRSLNESSVSLTREAIERIVGASLNKQPQSQANDSKSQQLRIKDEPRDVCPNQESKSPAEQEPQPSLDDRPEPKVETPKLSSNLDALIRITGDVITGSANYDEKAVPSLLLDGDKLGISPQLIDDLSVILSSPRFQLINWTLEWKELSQICQSYLQDADKMRNTDKQLKYLNIDYSQFLNQPYNNSWRDDPHYGIEKGYEQWYYTDSSESDYYQGPSKTTAARRSLDDSSDSDSEHFVRSTKRRTKKVPRLDSSESEMERKSRKPRQKFRKVRTTSSESDYTQDSQTSSLGSDGCKKNSKKIVKKTCNGTKKIINGRSKKSKSIIDPFHIFDENFQPSDASDDGTMTLFSADESKHETITGSAAFNAAQIIINKRSDPEVIKSLRMFRPSNKKVSSFNQKAINNGIKKKEHNADEKNTNDNLPKKFAPMLSTINLSPKIPLRRVDEVEKHLLNKKTISTSINTLDLSNELRHIQENMPFSSTKSSLTNYQKQKSRSRKKSSKPNLQELVQSMEFSEAPRVQHTVHVVQVTRNIPQSPNSTASGNTPPRNRSNIQLPGTPSSGGHDSGVGMSPAGQTPPPPTRSSSLQDVGEEANQPPDNSPGLADSTNTSTMDSMDGTRTVALTVLSNQRIASNQSPKKSPSPLTNNSQEQQQQHVVVRKPDGTLHLVSPNVVAGQRSILSLQNFEDGNISFARQVSVASVAGAETKTTQAQATRNAALPKFQQAFGKTICTLSTESTTVPSTSATETRESSAVPASAITNVHQRINAKSTANNSKSIQTSVQNASIVSIPSLQQAAAGTRQILNIVQSANSNATTVSGPTLQVVQNSTPGNVIYSIPSTPKIAGQNATQLISIPATAIANSRAPVQVKLNIIRTPYRPGQPIQAVVHTHRVQPPVQQTQTNQPQQQQQQQQPQQINSTMEIPNQASSSTLREQLREFDSVLEQVKQRSTGQSSSTDTTTIQTQTQTQTAQTAQIAATGVKQTQQVSVGALTQQLLMSSQSPSSAVEFPSNGSTLTFQQQDVYQQKVALMYTNKSSSSSTPNSTPVVVVTSYCQPAASPALSVTSQSSSSPCVTPAPTPVLSTGKTPPQSSSKSSKKSTTPKSVKVSAQTAAKQAPIPKPQQKPQEDPETTQRIYAILGQYAEQLRNSPDLNNKPAPRRRSNPPTNPNQSSKRKKSGSSKSKGGTSGQQTSEPSPSADDMNRTMGSSEDSSGGGGGAGSISGNGSSLMHIQDSPAGYSASEETLVSSNNNSQSGNNDSASLSNITETKPTTVTSDSNDSLEGNVKRRNLIFTEPNSGQARAVIVQEAPNVGETISSVTGGKVTTGTAVLVSGTNFMLPMNFVKSGQQITVVSGGSKLLAAVPAVRTTGNASGVSNAFVLQSLLSQANKVIQQQQNQPKLKLAHQSQIVIPQTGGVVRFANDDSSSDKSDSKPDSNKPPPSTTTIGLFQHSGVITSNPTIGQRILNSSTVKLPAVKADSAQKVVCLTTPAKMKEIDAQNTTTIALAFTPSTDGAGAAANATAIKEMKDLETSSKVETLTATTSTKGLKRKEEQIDDTFHLNATADATQSLNKKSKQQASQASAMTSTTITSTMDNSSQFLVSVGTTSSDSQESASSTIPSSAIESSSMDGTKVENGVLCGNARLQEAWEPERKGSPDTPWRYPPTTNALGMEPLKAYSRDSESSEVTQNSVLQTINKGQAIEMSSGGIFQTKKFFPSMNNAKSLVKSGQANNARPTAEQENQQRKQLAMEHALRLQKSLSEECEDLGVDEPSTSDLFPEADLLFDTNNSPAFDHSSQEASCSQTLSGGMSLSNNKTYAGANSTLSFFKTIDSVSSGSRDASPVVTPKNSASVSIKKKAPVQRRVTKPKESPAKKVKRLSDGLLPADGTPQAKHIRLSLVENLSQDEVSNSNTDVSRLSPIIGNGSSKEPEKPKIVHKSAKPHDSTSHEVPDTATGEHIDQHTANHASSSLSSEGDVNLALLEDGAANVTVPSPIPSITGSLLNMNNRFTYANKKRPAANSTAAMKSQRSSDFFSTEGLVSERTKSSTDNDEDEEDEEDQEDDESSSVSESFGPTEISGIGNGLQDIIRNVSTVKVTPVDHPTLSAKRKATITRKTSINHKDSTSGSFALNKLADAKVTVAKKPKIVAATTPTLSVMSENESSSPVPSGDRVYDISPSDDETSSATVMSNSTLDVGIEHCSAAAGRRSSLRGHVKKENCGCCNGSPERPKVKKIGPSKPQPCSDQVTAKLKKPKQQQQPAKQLAKKR
ncbi:uncharacterized protein LOC131666651 [Phymastichus coffea]|uniref:uncharacterized protein LOC131666651 n=1 Tax=Phymastichus coffea TaxID=108790 RepID=UPI00273B0A28|nr:uncharacterized protein LOC131666651 [Phymastichus coffea]